MDNALGRTFTSKGIITYALPTLCMLLFMSTYTIVDGIFVAQLVGENALSAVNIVLPAINVIFAVGLMLGTGGVAVLGRLMGEGKTHEARSVLSEIYILGILIGVFFTVFCVSFPVQIVAFLGANEVITPLAESYLLALMPFGLCFVLQMFAQTFFVTAGKPGLGFAVCVSGGLVNIVLDYILISPSLFDMGIVGAGVATGLGAAVPGLFGLLYFSFARKGALRFAKPVFSLKTIGQIAYNGSSEMVSNLSVAVTTVLFNVTLISMVGESGVAAISVILYVQMIQAALYFGYSMGVAPLISFKFGEQNHRQLARCVRVSLRFVGAVSVVVVGLSLLFANQAVAIFISPESSTFEMAREGFMIFSVAYLFMGLNIFISSLFTALSNGKISATISFLRTLVLTVIALLVLPQLMGIVGVWLAVPLAEGLTLLLSTFFYRRYKARYCY